MIPLREFEFHIPEVILKRGLDYLERGLVRDFIEVENGHYEFYVDGEEEYVVNLEVKNEVIVEHTCTCPYEHGDICKHVAASIMYLLKDTLIKETKAEKTKKGRPKSSEKGKTVNNQVNAILKKVDEGELKKFIMDLVKEDSKVKNYFLLYFSHYNNNDSFNNYSKVIKEGIKIYAGRDGFISVSAGKRLAKYISGQLDLVKNKIDQNNLMSAIYLCRAIHENVINFYKKLIYENYQVEQIVDNAFHFLKEIGDENASPIIKQSIYEYALSLFKSGICNQTPWFVTPLSLAAYVASSEKEIDLVLELSDSYVSEGGEIVDIKVFKYLIIQEYKNDEEANKYVFENLDSHYFRKIAIQKFIDEGDFEKAVEYAKKGIELCKKGHHGLVHEYENTLMELYKRLNYKEEIIRLAEKFYIAGDNYADNYKLLKMLIDENDFKNYVDKIIHKIEKKKYWYDKKLVIHIYVQEERWGDLLEMAKKEKELDGLHTCEMNAPTELKKDYVELYENLIIDKLTFAHSREHYAHACQFLGRLYEIGAGARADILISHLRRLYSRKPALIEELNLAQSR